VRKNFINIKNQEEHIIFVTLIMKF